MNKLPNPNDIFPNQYHTMCFVKNVVKAPNIEIGDYTYYDDEKDPTQFEKNNVKFNYPEFGDKLKIGKFCSIAQGTQFIMGSANHRLSSVTTYPFAVFGGEWEKRTPDHMAQLPRKGDTIVGDDVWIGRNSVIMPGVKIGTGSIVAANSVVVKDIEPYSIVGGNPAKFIKKRFDQELIELLFEYKWWDFDEEKLVEVLPMLCDPDLEHVKSRIRSEIG